jgi:hypothetical protein
VSLADSADVSGSQGRALQYRGGACVTLGKFYKGGVGVKKDAKKAKE